MFCSVLLTSCLTAIKNHVIKYCKKIYERSGKKLLWSIKNTGEVLDKLKARDFNATSLPSYNLSTLYTTLPQTLIIDKPIDHLERTFQRDGSPYLAYNDRNTFLLWKSLKFYSKCKWCVDLFVGQHFYTILYVLDTSCRDSNGH